MSIPKIIHYCWFGGNPLPPLAQKCIASWKKFCPDYEIMEWNEQNFDLQQAPLYVRQAYEAKKWAFVTDYVRLQVVYDRGGIYLDTDVELVKPLDSLLKYNAYFGFERPKFVATGLGFGAEAGSQVVKEMMDIYQNRSFLQPDGSCDCTPCPELNTPVLLKRGLILDGKTQLLPGGIGILAVDWLCPVNYETGICTRTENTLSIHWFSASWQTEDERKRKKEYDSYLRREQRKYQLSRLPNKIGTAVFGEKCYGKIRRFLKGHD